MLELVVAAITLIFALVVVGAARAVRRRGHGARRPADARTGYADGGAVPYGSGFDAGGLGAGSFGGDAGCGGGDGGGGSC